MVLMRIDELNIDTNRLAEICAKHDVARLELFGSFARGEASPESDLDLLVTFHPDARIGLGIVALQQDLGELFGRPVDLMTRSAIERSPNKYLRHFARRSTEPLYECV